MTQSLGLFPGSQFIVEQEGQDYYHFLISSSLGIRQHFRFPKLVKGFSGLSSDKSDNMIIHSIALLDQMDKDINTLVKPHIDSLRKTTVSKGKDTHSDPGHKQRGTPVDRYCETCYNQIWLKLHRSKWFFFLQNYRRCILSWSTALCSWD